MTFSTDSCGVSFNFIKSTPAPPDPSSLAARLSSTDIGTRDDGEKYSIKEDARCEAMMKLNYNPKHDVLVPVDPGRTDLCTGIFVDVSVSQTEVQAPADDLNVNRPPLK